MKKALFLAVAIMASAAFGDVRPASPEQMSGKTVLQFWADNGIEAGWNLGNTMDAVKVGVYIVKQGNLVRKIAVR
ncbi:hypothetical protein R83H12_02182 [Fibrobacteria bacterium R8-3-H12]